MLKNQWFAILESKEVKSKPVGVKRLDKNLVLFRDSTNKVICMEDKCVHRGARLSQGTLCDDIISCPFHGFAFDTNGKCLLIPANGKVSKVPNVFNTITYETYEIDGFIFMYNSLEKPESPPKYFNNLKDFTHNTISVKMDVHYTRCIENQLDVVHVPFVHSKTIGKQFKTLVNGPVVIWDEEQMTFYVYNDFDNGQIPLKAGEITNYLDLFNLSFIMPNIWQNNIADKFKIVIAFAPIDEESTMIYLRFEQAFLKVPGITQVVNFIGNRYNLKVLKEDNRIVSKQLPNKTTKDLKEHLIQGDKPIIEYRKRYFELLDQD